jgi:hypothetical protein
MMTSCLLEGSCVLISLTLIFLTGARVVREIRAGIQAHVQI